MAEISAPGSARWQCCKLEVALWATPTVSRLSKKKNKTLTAAQIFLRLRRRHEGEEWGFFKEVRNKTGYSGGPERYADAIAINLWPSRGHEIHGFEIKASRADLLKELKTPSKAEAIQQFCDRWWLVLGHHTLIKAGECPPTWGVMVPYGSGLTVMIEAPKLKSKPLDKGFLMSIIRRFSVSTGDDEIIKQQIADARDEGFNRGKKDAEYAAKCDDEVNEYAVKHLKDLQDSVMKFQEDSGINLGYRLSQADRVAKVIKMSHDAARLKQELRRATAVRDGYDDLVKALEALEVQP